MRLVYVILWALNIFTSLKITNSKIRSEPIIEDNNDLDEIFWESFKISELIDNQNQNLKSHVDEGVKTQSVNPNKEKVSIKSENGNESLLSNQATIGSSKEKLASPILQEEIQDNNKKLTASK